MSVTALKPASRPRMRQFYQLLKAFKPPSFTRFRAYKCATWPNQFHIDKTKMDEIKCRLIRHSNSKLRLRKHEEFSMADEGGIGVLVYTPISLFHDPPVGSHDPQVSSSSLATGGRGGRINLRDLPACLVRFTLTQVLLSSKSAKKKKKINTSHFLLALSP